MCGIAGIFEPQTTDARALEHRARAMAGRLAHRGPDGEGVFIDDARGVALAHRRLAVRDLTPLGDQPMTTDDGALTLVYNGELYDTDLLRAHVDGPVRGTSDTAVLLALLRTVGVERALPMLSGMFAFALFDARARTLTVARDRFGKKPLTLFTHDGGVLFASEARALTSDPRGPRALDEESTRLFFKYGCVPGARSIYAGAEKLPPGTFARFAVDDTGRVRSSGAVPFVRADALLDDRAHGALSLEDGARVVEGALTDAVRRRLVADVPLGAFLSSGVDSSLVVALMKRCGVERPVTFTIGAPGDDDDERARAREIARALGTEHHERAVTPGDLLAALDEIPRLFDEPFADSSAIPTLLLSRLARSHVTVALSGDGADELFCGYRQHAFVRALAPLVRGLPRAMRTALARGARDLRVDDGALAALRSLLAKRAPALAYLSPHAFTKAAIALASSDPLALHSHLREVAHDDENPAGAPRSDRGPPAIARAQAELVDAMRFDDLTRYLHDDILVKVDRASMACGLEVRSPFLDLDVARSAFAIAPKSVLGRLPSPDGRGQKRVLRRILERHLSLSLLSPVKRGFGVPMSSWLRGPLRPALDEVTTTDAVRSLGLDVERVRALKEGHLSGARTNPSALFALLVFSRFHAQRG